MTMDYLQQVVFNALKKNPDLDESYARSFALGVKQPIDLCGLDYGNLDRVAAELGCSPDDIDAFMMITKAIYNAGKCEHTAAENRAYTAQVQAAISGLFEEEAAKQRGLDL